MPARLLVPVGLLELLLLLLLVGLVVIRVGSVDFGVNGLRLGTVGMEVPRVRTALSVLVALVETGLLVVVVVVLLVLDTVVLEATCFLGVVDEGEDVLVVLKFSIEMGGLNLETKSGGMKPSRWLSS